MIGVGGSDSMGTAQITDDAVGAYSASGCGATCKKPDFVAPGSHLQGLRVPERLYRRSTHPGGRIDGRYFRGSGTGQAAACPRARRSVLQKYPTLTPDQVKKFFVTYANALAGSTATAQGAGEIQLGTMLAEDARQLHPEVQRSHRHRHRSSSPAAPTS